MACPTSYDVRIAVRADQSRPGHTGRCGTGSATTSRTTPTPTNGKKLLRELAELSPEPVRVRTHNLLTSGDGTPALKWGSTNAYTEDAARQPGLRLDDHGPIFDAYVEAGNMPFIQVGFTPEALSDDPGPYRHNWALERPLHDIMTGWAAPPNDLAKWGGLVEAWARHLVERYGARQGREPGRGKCWNEPDGHYWTGTIPEFCAMYDATAKAIRRVLPSARVGGPHTCGAFANQKAQTFLRGFLQHVVDTGSPIDFIAFHAKGNPVVHEGHVRMGLAQAAPRHRDQPRDHQRVPRAQGHLPVVIGESDPEGCAACSARVIRRTATATARSTASMSSRACCAPTSCRAAPASRSKAP